MTAPVHRPAQGASSHAGSSSIAPPSAVELLHAVTLRPTDIAWNGSSYTGARLSHLDAEAARGTPGVVDVVVRKDFVGIIASQPGQARQARTRLQPGWAVPVAAPGVPAADTGSATGRETAAPSQSEGRLSRTYSWPAPQQQAPAWAIAQYSGDALVVWTCTRHSDALRRELSQLCGLPQEAVRIIANGQVDTEGYDVAADAALLSRSCGRPVRVQQDPDASDAQPISVSVSGTPAPAGASQDSAGRSGSPLPVSELIVSFDLHPGRRPSIAALLCGVEIQHPPEHVVRMADYAPQARYLPASNDARPQAGMLGLPAAAQVFAQESFFDEACALRGHDPVQARLDAIDDATGRELIASVAARAKWSQARRKNSYEGRGFAYAHVIDQTRQPPQEVWSAWVADIRVDPATGAIDLTGLTVGHNTGALRTSAAPRIEEDVRKAATRWLRDASSHDSWGASSETDFPLARSATQVQLVEQGPVGLAWSRDAELPAAAAIANAIHDATGIRLRQPPFDAGELKRQLSLAGNGGRSKKAAYGLLGGMAAAAGSLLVAAMPWRPAIAPVANIDTSIYSAAAIERGRLVAAAGDCMVCHTAEGGVPNAGGLALETPFGKIYTTNITPDKETGIGAWSYAAFERAMREGIHRDGRHLYPAFPYTAFAKMSDADMQSLYAYLMTQEPVTNRVEPTQLSFPYSMRPLLAGWNLLFHKNETYQPDPSQTTLWNRGAYLVQGMGHCAACHSPRNALGAEKSGEHNFLAGGFAEGWEAPALNALSKAPIAWTEEELYGYLRTGYSSLHGVASGPMAPVIQSMAELPDQDVRAIAHYLGTLAPTPPTEVSPALQAARLEAQSRNDQRVMSLAGENLFQGACAVCHDAREGPPLFGARPSLALNTNLHSDSPDNAIQILLHGIDDPAMAELGYMPGFGDSMNDEQLETLLEYLRMRFAPDKPAWEGLPEKIRSLRDGAEG
ncbi:c-type cytochrome [Pusillimonas sp.]|uniref:c-type cytochrome n=1 Tax=Pusillimonas sp. TaxID=3040095 RepID=UPI0029AAEB52|nr:c-type cytochrome [Pusillimonas sp.]MDX3893424.1 c-type cytochrome [Pusillimonas sp.]